MAYEKERSEGTLVFIRIENLKKLAYSGKLSPKLKTATNQLIQALVKKDRRKIEKISRLHQEISSGYGLNEKYPYNEDDDYNKEKTGTTAYHEFDMISHGDY